MEYNNGKSFQIIAREALWKFPSSPHLRNVIFFSCAFFLHFFWIFYFTLSVVTLSFLQYMLL
jgi:hypothetical protein